MTSVLPTPYSSHTMNSKLLFAVIVVIVLPACGGPPEPEPAPPPVIPPATVDITYDEVYQAQVDFIQHIAERGIHSEENVLRCVTVLYDLLGLTDPDPSPRLAIRHALSELDASTPAEKKYPAYYRAYAEVMRLTETDEVHPLETALVWMTIATEARR